MVAARTFISDRIISIRKANGGNLGDILEAGAYYSVRAKDIESFERYIAQLNTFYHDLA